jgi:hypothetical protein
MSWNEDLKLFTGYLRHDAENTKKGDTGRSNYVTAIEEIMLRYKDSPKEKEYLVSVIIDIYISYVKDMNSLYALVDLWHKVVVNSTDCMKSRLEKEINDIVIKNKTVINTFIRIINDNGLDKEYLEIRSWTLPFPLNDVVCVEETKVPEVVNRFLRRKKTVYHTKTRMLSKDEVIAIITRRFG